MGFLCIPSDSALVLSFGADIRKAASPPFFLTRPRILPIRLKLLPILISFGLIKLFKFKGRVGLNQ